MNNITIYIKIDSIKFLNLLKEKIKNLSFEKALQEDYKNNQILIIKGKKIVILKENEPKLFLGKMIFYRIASLFYISSYSINKFVNDLDSINFEKLENHE